MSGFKTFVIVFLAVICALIVWNCVSNYQEYQIEDCIDRGIPPPVCEAYYG